MDNRTTAALMQKMIAYSNGNLHDIAHFIKVHSYARTIGIQEGLTDYEQETLELAAIIHDIACPLCREKYGNTNGRHQEEESAPLVEAILDGIDIPGAMADRISYLVCHHHTYTNVDGIDYQILLEADFLVNADESNMSRDAILNARNGFYRTKTGIEMLDLIYRVSL